MDADMGYALGRPLWGALIIKLKTFILWHVADVLEQFFLLDAVYNFGH